jgi:hypothetical protein
MKKLTPCSPLKVNRRFGVTYRLHLQGRISRERYQHEIRWEAGLSPASAGYLLGLLFDPEDVGDIFLRNVGLSPNYKALQPRRP